MDKLELVRYGSPILRKKAKPVERITEEIRDLAANMFELMRKSQGIGLAASQVGIQKRIFVVDAAEYIGEAGRPFAMANPVIIKLYGGWSTAEEGCLSIPDIEGDVKRAKQIMIRGIDIDKGKVEFVATNLLARILQHEVDHLDGILFIDRMKFLDGLKVKNYLRRVRQ